MSIKIIAALSTNRVIGDKGKIPWFIRGELKRFNSIINYLPLEYRSLEPEEKKINKKNNPPRMVVEFFNEQKNIKNINCYSNDGGKWKKPNLKFEDKSRI